MPSDVPPKDVQPEPRYFELPAGSYLWRVTGKHEAAGALFNPLPPEADGYDSRLGGRFGPSPECRYTYCYAAFDDLTALCETLLRDFGFDGPLRYLPWREIAGRRLAIVETLAPLTLVSLLDAADLAAARQDSWLVHAEQADYRITRRWAHWLRDSIGPDGKSRPDGIVWRSKRQPSGRAVLLFGDRCEHVVTQSEFGSRSLDDSAGMAWLDRRLALLHTVLPPLTKRVALVTDPIGDDR